MLLNECALWVNNIIYLVLALRLEKVGGDWGHGGSKPSQPEKAGGYWGHGGSEPNQPLLMTGVAQTSGSRAH